MNRVNIDPKPVWYFVLLMVAGSGLGPLIDAMSKVLTEEYSVAQIVWLRYAAHTVIAGGLLKIASRARGERAEPELRGMNTIQIVRGFFQFSTSILILLALKGLSLGTVLTIVFIAPVIVVGIRFWGVERDRDPLLLLLSAAGLGGVISVFYPDLKGGGISYLAAFGAAISFALYILYTGRVASKKTPLENSFHTAAFGSIVGFPIALYYWEAINIEIYMILSTIGILSVISHILIAKALQHSMSTAVAPIAYVEVPIGIIYDLILFNKKPTELTILGSLIIVTVGVLVGARLHLRAKRLLQESC